VKGDEAGIRLELTGKCRTGVGLLHLMEKIVLACWGSVWIVVESGFWDRCLLPCLCGSVSPAVLYMMCVCVCVCACVRVCVCACRYMFICVCVCVYVCI